MLTVVERSGECRVRDLAAMMGVSHVTVSKTVARLQRAGVVTTAPYRPVSLTPAGLKLARDARERHEVVRRFLTAIGVSAAQAEIDAEGIEHHVSGATIRAMRRVLAGGGGSESDATRGELRR